MNKWILSVKFFKKNLIMLNQNFSYAENKIVILSVVTKLVRKFFLAKYFLKISLYRKLSYLSSEKRQKTFAFQVLIKMRIILVQSDVFLAERCTEGKGVGFKPG